MIAHLEKLYRDETMRRFVRFILVGVLNTLFGLTVFIIAETVIGLHHQIALVLQFVIGVIWNYFTHARLVFYSQGFSKMPLYAACYVGIYLFNAASLEGLHLASVDPTIAQAFLTPITAGLAFFMISKVLTGRFPLIEKAPESK